MLAIFHNFVLQCVLCIIINRTDKLIRIQHEKKHGKGSKNSSAYFDNKMIEEEEMEKQIDDGTFDECAYVKDDDDLCA